VAQPTSPGTSTSSFCRPASSRASWAAWTYSAMAGETPGQAGSISPVVSQDTISIRQGALPRAVQPKRPGGTGHSAPKSSLSGIEVFPETEEGRVSAVAGGPARASGTA